MSVLFGRSTAPNYKGRASGPDLRLPWRVAPLEGKYYGTDIWDSDDGLVVSVWCHEEGCVPSVREREGKPWTGWTEDWRERCCDGHWESESDYLRACAIVEAVHRGVARPQRLSAADVRRHPNPLAEGGPRVSEPLKPCPFCGQQNWLTVGSAFHWGRRVQCAGEHSDGLPCGTSGPIRDDDDQAIAAWNRRAPPPETVAAFDKMRADLKWDRPRDASLLQWPPISHMNAEEGE